MANFEAYVDFRKKYLNSGKSFFSKIWREDAMIEVLNIIIKNIWLGLEKYVICRTDLLIGKPGRKQIS